MATSAHAHAEAVASISAETETEAVAEAQAAALVSAGAEAERETEAVADAQAVALVSAEAASAEEEGTPWVGGPLEVAWNDDAGRAVDLPLITSGDRLIVTTTDKKLFCYEMSTGKRTWKRRFKVDLPTAPAVLAAEDGMADTESGAGGRVFLQVGAREDAKLHALRLENGDDLWKLPSYPRAIQLLALQGNLFALDLVGTLQSLDPDDGSLVWDVEGFGWDSPGLVASEDALFVLARSDSLVALAPSTGKRLWAAHVPGRYVARPHLDGSRLLLTATEGDVYEVQVSDGSVRALGRRRAQQLLPPVPIGGRVLTVSSGGWVEAGAEEIPGSAASGANANTPNTANAANATNTASTLNTANDANAANTANTPNTANAADATNTANAADATNTANAADATNAANAADASTGDLGAAWSADLGEAVRGTPLAAGGLLLVPTSGGRLVALRGDTGAQVWSLELGERLSVAPLLTDRYLVVATNQGDVYAYLH